MTQNKFLQNDYIISQTLKRNFKMAAYEYPDITPKAKGPFSPLVTLPSV